MSSEVAIQVDHLRKVYPRRPRPLDALAAIVRGRLLDRGEPAALDDIDLAVARGGSLGIVGRNGSGKTTLLRILSGGLSATSGSVRLRGRAAALIDLGAGIDPEFSGRENALLLGVLAGSTRREVRANIEEIWDFSGLGDAFDQPVRTYSTGMTLRLAFSSAIVAHPEILLIDEVLAVGDAFFQQRCLLRIRQLREQGCTVVLVSHDPSAVLGFCDSALWLDRGRVVSSGDPGRVMRDYLASHYDPAGTPDEHRTALSRPAGEYTDTSLRPADTIVNVDSRHGDGRARVIGLDLRDDAGEPLQSPRPGDPVRIVITLEALAPIASPVVGFTLRNRLGEILSATNNAHQGHTLSPLEVKHRLSVEFELRWPPLASGTFSLSPAIADGTLEQHSMSDWIDNALVFEVTNAEARYGWLELEEVRVRSSVEGHTPL